MLPDQTCIPEEVTRLAKAALNDCYSSINGLSLPWKVSYKTEIAKIMELCRIPQLNKISIWENIVPLINNWDLEDINSRIKSKLPHSLKWLPTVFVENGAQSYIDGSPE